MICGEERPLNATTRDSVGALPQVNVRLRTELLKILPLGPLNGQLEGFAGFLTGTFFAPDRSYLPLSESLVGKSTEDWSIRDSTRN